MDVFVVVAVLVGVMAELWQAAYVLLRVGVGLAQAECLTPHAPARDGFEFINTHRHTENAHP